MDTENACLPRVLVDTLLSSSVQSPKTSYEPEPFVNLAKSIKDFVDSCAGNNLAKMGNMFFAAYPLDREKELARIHEVLQREIPRRCRWWGLCKQGELKAVATFDMALSMRPTPSTARAKDYIESERRRRPPGWTDQEYQSIIASLDIARQTRLTSYFPHTSSSVPPSSSSVSPSSSIPPGKSYVLSGEPPDDDDIRLRRRLFDRPSSATEIPEHETMTTVFPRALLQPLTPTPAPPALRSPSPDPALPALRPFSPQLEIEDYGDKNEANMESILMARRRRRERLFGRRVYTVQQPKDSLSGDVWIPMSRVNVTVPTKEDVLALVSSLNKNA